MDRYSVTRPTPPLPLWENYQFDLDTLMILSFIIVILPLTHHTLQAKTCHRFTTSSRLPLIYFFFTSVLHGTN